MSPKTQSAQPLYMADKDDLWELQQKLRPDLTREDFEKAWGEFVELKRRRALNG